MKIIAPKPFTFSAEEGNRAVLLLHGFTGSSADVRMLGRFLQKKGYTCHAPQYKGHGVPPEQLVTTGPDDYWQDVMAGYDYLKSLGYEEIAVVGLSLGGVFSLKLGYTVPIKGIVPMCAPMNLDIEKMQNGVTEYAREYKSREKKSSEQINEELKHFKETPLRTLHLLANLLKEVRNSIDLIYGPTFVVQSTHDEMINPDDASFIYKNIESVKKDLKWYEQSPHVITLGKEKEQLHEDVYSFLESLDWTK
ncbi:carboxylesterase [Lottiidibacillus patelloidae]|uniref:Carboxylesterase n=1 Tax=Lottiidibacillus patelloidae TaxID=2670334 RepID=A0A263BR50_9BACI|nr:carboxylesterase [Lottiidibacillus patelloidae]OZM56048.1 carboxylesterase [Lottiidibacillus patelloidae]